MNGHWTLTIRKYKNGRFTGRTWRCSECGGVAFEIDRFPSYEHFCHHCGANMVDTPQLYIKEAEEDEGLGWEEF